MARKDSPENSERIIDQPTALQITQVRATLCCESCIIKFGQGRLSARHSACGRCEIGIARRKPPACDADGIGGGAETKIVAGHRQADAAASRVADVPAKSTH